MHMLDIVQDKPEIEYYNGHPFPKVSPKRTHALVQAALLKIVSACAGERGDVGVEWRFALGVVDGTPSEFLPDVAFISYERLDALSDEAAEEPPFAPDLAIEVRSPKENAALRARKIAKYLACGSVLVLDVDPDKQQIIAHDHSGKRIFNAGSTFAHPAFPWLSFDVASIFPKPRKRP